MLNYRFGSVSGRSTPCSQTAGLSRATLLRLDYKSPVGEVGGVRATVVRPRLHYWRRLAGRSPSGAQNQPQRGAIASARESLEESGDAHPGLSR